MLKQRIITAVIMAAVFFVALFGLSTAIFASVCLVALLVAVHEWARLAGVRHRGVEFILLFLFLAAGLLAVFGTGLAPGTGFPPLLVGIAGGAATLFWIAVAPAWLRNGWPTRAPLPMSILGALLILAFWISGIELHAHSPWLLLGTLAIVWIADTGAYFSGRRFGKRKLAPTISPGKSWEGVYGGLACVLAYAAAVLALSPLRSAGPRMALTIAVAAVLLAMISVVGDLFESWLKRQAGVKDSGTLLPGHGGVLDRIDALLPALPLATLFLRAVS